MHYIFVHGAWHGAWCWQELEPYLQHLNYKLIDLPIHKKQSTLADCIQHVVECCKEHDDVVLVGHSMAGFIISKVAEIIPNKIKKLFFIAAYIPDNNQSISECCQQDELIEWSNLATFEQGFFYLCEHAMHLMYAGCDDDLITYAKQKLSPQSARIFLARLQINYDNSIPSYYIICELDNVISKQYQNKMINRLNPTHVLTINAGHAVYFSHPEKLFSYLTG